MEVSSKETLLTNLSYLLRIYCNDKRLTINLDIEQCEASYMYINVFLHSGRCLDVPVHELSRNSSCFAAGYDFSILLTLCSCIAISCISASSLLAYTCSRLLMYNFALLCQRAIAIVIFRRWPNNLEHKLHYLYPQIYVHEITIDIFNVNKIKIKTLY